MRFSGTITLQYDTPFAPYRAREYGQALKWLTDSGFDGAEVCISSYEDVDVRKVRKDLDERGLGCSTISTGQSRLLEGISLLHTGGELKKAQERMKQHIDAAVILGSKVTLGLLRGPGEPGKEEEQKQTLARNLEPVITYAQDRRVTIILEAINRYETSLFNSADDAMSFVERELANAGCMGILWDIFHANIEDARFDEAIERMGRRLCHVHVADSNRMFPGYGHIDFERIVEKLGNAGFQEYMSFECMNLPTVESVRREAGLFVRKMRGVAQG